MNRLPIVLEKADLVAGDGGVPMMEVLKMGQSSSTQKVDGLTRLYGNNTEQNAAARDAAAANAGRVIGGGGFLKELGK